MEDPLPENIDGEKVFRHSFEHRVDWGQIALGVAVIVAAVVVYRLLADREDVEQSLPQPEGDWRDPQFEDTSGMMQEQIDHTHR